MAEERKDKEDGQPGSWGQSEGQQPRPKGGREGKSPYMVCVGGTWMRSE